MSDLEKKAYRMLKEFLRGENKSIDKIKEAIDIVLEMSIFKDSNKDEIKNKNCIMKKILGRSSSLVRFLTRCRNWWKVL